MKIENIRTWIYKNPGMMLVRFQNELYPFTMTELENSIVHINKNTIFILHPTLDVEVKLQKKDVLDLIKRI